MQKETFHCILLVCSLMLSTGCIRAQNQATDNLTGHAIPACHKVPSQANYNVQKSSVALNGNLLEDATELYEGLKNNLCSKVYEIEYLVLVVVHIKQTVEDDGQLLECDAMLKASELIAERFKLPARYSLQTITIVNAYDEERMIYDYVIAFRKESIVKMEGDSQQ